MKTKNKLICSSCKSDQIKYLPDVDGSSWVSAHFQQDTTTGQFKLVAEGSAPGSDDMVNVEKIDRDIINWNDGRPFFVCEGCSAEIDGYNELELEEIK